MSNSNRPKKGLDQKEAIISRRVAKTETKVNKKTVLISVLSFLLIVILISSAIGVDYIKETGYFNRKKAILETDNFQITVPMMQYYFYSVVYENVEFYVNNYGLDPNKPLREQKVQDTNQTWFDFFMQDYLSEAKLMISYAEEAARNGIKLTDKDKTKVDKELQQLKDKAKEDKRTFKEYIKDRFGKGVLKSDIVKAIELRTLAYKRLHQINSQFEFTEEQIVDRFGHRKDEYLFVDFKQYTFETEGQEKTEEELAEELAAVDSSAQFDTWLVLYLSKKLGVDDPGKLTKEQAKKINDTVADAYYKERKFNYNDKTGFTDWAFKDALTDNAKKPGDSIVVPGEREGTFTVYYIVKSPYRDESETRDIRYLFFSTKDFGGKQEAYNYANKIYNEWKKESDKSEERFTDYEQIHNDFTYKPSRNIRNGQYAKEFNDWMFHETRKHGDTTLISLDEGSYIVFYVGKGKPAWQAGLIEELIEVKMQEINQNKPDEYKVVVNNKYIKNIP